jgi:hypothetical protein
MRWLALKKLPAPDLAYKCSIARRDLAANGYGMRPSFDLKTFERIVIEVH